MFHIEGQSGGQVFCLVIVALLLRSNYIGIFPNQISGEMFFLLNDIPTGLIRSKYPTKNINISSTKYVKFCLLKNIPAG